jgi:hypothetical protein
VDANVLLEDAEFAFMLTAGSSSTPSPLRQPGDANDDGDVSIFDALAILQYDVGWEVVINPINADVNADGSANIFDALLILQYDVGWDVELQ